MAPRGVFDLQLNMNRNRINDPRRVDRRALSEIVTSGALPVLQFSKPGYTRELLQSINRLCAEFGDQLEVRFYGHYQEPFDASALRELRDVQRLSIDCLTSMENEQEIADLRSLTHLSFGVFRFDRPRFLETLNIGSLKELSLSQNEKRNFDLAPLGDGRSLRRLWLNGHTKNIAAIATLPELHEITLGSISNHVPLHFLNGMLGLRSLNLILGGRPSFDEVRHSTLQSLSVIRVRGLSSVGALQRFPNLRSLQVEDQLQIGSIALDGAPLERVLLIICKNLARIDGLETLSNLFELRISRTKLNLDMLADQIWPASMKILALYSGSRAWNEKTRAKLALRGYREIPSDR